MGRGDLLDVFARRGIELGTSIVLAVAWSNHLEELFGDRTREIAGALARKARGPEIRNPAAFATWAFKQPIGRWLPDGELDLILHGKRRKAGEEGVTEAAPTGISEVLASLGAVAGLGCSA